MTTPPPEIGRMLRAFRLAHNNMSQTALADLLSVNHTLVSRIESGTRHPHASQAAHYARCLGLPVMDVAMAICELDPRAVRADIEAELRPVLFREFLIGNISQAESALRMYDRHSEMLTVVGREPALEEAA